MNPLVQVVLRGAAADENIFKTKTVVGNGFNPVWNEVSLAQLSVDHDRR